MAAYNRSISLLGGSRDHDEGSDDDSISFVPVSLNANATTTPQTSHEKEKKRLKKQKKKQEKKLAQLQDKQQARRENERKAFEDDVSCRLDELSGSKNDLMQMSTSERLDFAGSLLSESQSLFQEVETVMAAPESRIQESAKDDEDFSNTLNAIKKKKDLEKQKERGELECIHSNICYLVENSIFVDF